MSYSFMMLRRRLLSCLMSSLLLLLTACTGDGSTPPSRTLEPSRSPTVPASGEWVTSAVGGMGWEVRHPSSWRFQNFTDSCRISRQGALFSNVEHDFATPDLEGNCTTAWDMRGLPDDLVVIEVSHWTGGPTFLPSDEPDRPGFPLSLDDARPSTSQHEAAYGAPQPSLGIAVRWHGDDRYLVKVWLGPEASEEDREVAGRVVASISLPPGPGEPSPGEGSEVHGSPPGLPVIAVLREPPSKDAWVTGYLTFFSPPLRLCASAGESAPLACIGDHLRVVGLDLDAPRVRNKFEGAIGGEALVSLYGRVIPSRQEQGESYASGDLRVHLQEIRFCKEECLDILVERWRRWKRAHA